MTAERSRWRGLLETLGALGVVGGLLLVGVEVRQANRIATAQVVMELGAASNQINSARFGDPGVARLIMTLGAGGGTELAAVDSSRVVGLAYHIHNILWSAQTAYDSGILGIDALDNYRNDLAITLEGWPGIVPHLVEIYETQPGKRNAYVFEPLAQVASSR